MKRFCNVAAAVVVLLTCTTPLFAETLAEREQRLTTERNTTHPGLLRSDTSAPSCPGKSITPPVSINGQMTTSTCIDSILGSREDVYIIQGVAGQTITVDYSSTAYEVFLYMYLGGGVSAKTNRVSFLSSNGTSRVQMTHTFTSTETYYLEVETLFSPGGSQPTLGAYTLSIGLNGQNATCTANTTTLCLSGGRFAVSVAWQTSGGSTGTGQAIPMTADTGYFWFFNSSNVELVVKVLDGRTLNNKFWVFFGALTDVQYTMTVRDTQTGAVKTYVNPQGKMASVGDTSAF